MLRVRRGFTEVSARRGKPAVFAEGPGRRALSSHRGTAMCWERWMRRVRRGFTEVSAKCGKPAVFAAREGPGKAGALIASRNRDVLGALDAARVRHGFTEVRAKCGKPAVFAARERTGRRAAPPPRAGARG